MRRVIPMVLVVFLTGCGDDQPSPTVEPTPPGEGTGGTVATKQDPVPTPTPPQPPEAGGAVVMDEAFELRASAGGPYTSGALARFGITLTPRGIYHVNEEFPMTVEITAPAGVAFPKTTLERADAAEFGEQRARFDVPFTPSAAGQHTVQAKVSFAVCTPENCIPDERTLAVVLPVN
jgi:hypothetical protein